ncbi:hypothetical protein QFC20_004488 [Naganishia adeliensis]|uniref:Uncharacterized protein n=1 Tax=Naganishia adeliensis TaxID=92952 RepID=A0ACC2W0Y4_9TREE|nr:hypothetical protein QFC20_004488 [Naganishia adeliensis]
MSWCRHSAISSTCRRASSSIQHHALSTSTPVNKKFKPQDLFLLPGQPKARKSKVPKKVLAWKAQREGLVAEGNSAEVEPVALFAEEIEDWRSPWKGRIAGDENEPFGLKRGAAFRFGIPKLRRVQDEPEDDGQLPFGIGPRAVLVGRKPSPTHCQSLPETRMSQRVRETRESLVDLDKPQSIPAPAVEVHPETVIPSWKIPTPSEYEKYGRKNRGSVRRERRPEEGRRRESSASWSDDADPRVDRRRREPPSKPQSRHERENDLAANLHTPSSSIDTPSPPAERTPGRWEPTKKISIPAMQGLRALHQSDPKTFSHAVLSEKFGVSREAVARILRSKFRDEQ